MYKHNIPIVISIYIWFSRKYVNKKMVREALLLIILPEMDQALIA